MNFSLERRSKDVALVATSVLLLLSTVSTATAQRSSSRASTQRPAPAADIPAINAVRVLVEDLSGNQEFPVLEPGQTVTIREGQKVRLRMQAITTDRGRKARYPSTRFTVVRPASLVAVGHADEAVGSLDLTGELRSDRADRQAVEWQILDNWPIPDQLMKGRIFIAIQGHGAGTGVPVPASNKVGVTLFTDSGFRGRAEILYGDDFNLADNTVGEDRIRSIRVPQGCVAWIYQDRNFRGNVDELRYDLDDLGRTRVGNDGASSVKVQCQQNQQPLPGQYDPGPNEPALPATNEQGQRGVTVFADDNFVGTRVFFVDGSYPDLRRMIIGTDNVSSVRPTAGCMAILYDDTDFQGRSMEVSTSMSSLKSTSLGDNRASSLRIFCR